MIYGDSERLHDDSESRGMGKIWIPGARSPGPVITEIYTPYLAIFSPLQEGFEKTESERNETKNRVIKFMHKLSNTVKRSED